MLFHQDLANRRYYFRKIPDSEAAKDQLERAARVRAFVCPDLKIAPPEIVWLCPAAPASKTGSLKPASVEELDSVVRFEIDLSTGYGYTPNNFSLHEIWIPNDLTAHPNLEYVIAHELRHAAQKKLCPAVLLDKARAEGDAYPYGFYILKRYLESIGHLSEDLRRDIESKEAAARESFRNKYPNGRYAMISLSARG